MKIKNPKTKKCVIKKKIKFQDYKHCLEATQLDNKINHSEKNTLNPGNFHKKNQ